MYLYIYIYIYLNSRTYLPIWCIIVVRRPCNKDSITHALVMGPANVTITRGAPQRRLPWKSRLTLSVQSGGGTGAVCRGQRISCDWSHTWAILAQAKRLSDVLIWETKTES